METTIEKQIERSKVSQPDRKIASNSKDHIPGWGMDADPENDPTYPMKHANGADHERLNYEKAPQQPLDMEILHSIERPNVTRVFGTSTPPTGLSGAIRRYAFKYSEATATHWMGLILADRVNAVEGVIDDLVHGHIPNIIAERGWKAEWKHNRTAFITKAATTTLLITAGIMLMTKKKRTKQLLKKG